MPKSWIARVTTAGAIWPCSESAASTATTMCSASTSKKRRSAARVSLRPKPSVPSGVNPRGIQRASKTLKNLSSAWVADQEVEISNGKISAYRVRMRVTFVLEG